jgi:peptide/nickel transport system permease protein
VAGGAGGGERPGGLLSELVADRTALFGVIVLALIVGMAVFAPLLAPYDPGVQSLRDRLTPPVWQEGGSWAHVLGTDHLGRDILSRIMYGARVSLVVGVSVVLLAGGFGIAVGLVAGYYGGRIDAILMRFVDTLLAFPGLLLALVILAVVGPSMASVILVLALSGWMVYARMARGIVLTARRLPYVEAAEMVGGRPGRVIFRHILPNLVSPMLTLAILEFANIVLAEAALSFLGLGVQPPATSWGLDVATGKDYLFVAWWPVTLPGLALAVTVLAINLVASWARITSDPQEREKRFARGVAAAERRRRRAADRRPAAGPAE